MDFIFLIFRNEERFADCAADFQIGIEAVAERKAEFPQSAKYRKHHKQSHGAHDNPNRSDAVNNVDCIILAGAPEIAFGYV